MSDLGIRISQEGIDVKTGTDKEMVLTSKYSIFKGSIQGTGTTSVARDGTPTTVTIAHGLGYIPMVQAFCKDLDDVTAAPNVYLPLPVVGLYDDGEGAFYQWNYIVKADSTNIYLVFTFEDLITTFGNNSSGTTEYLFGDESEARVILKNGYTTRTHTAISGDVLESISFYAKKEDGNATIVVSLYRIESGLPTTKFGSGSVSVNSTTMQVWTVDMGSLALTAGHEYGVAIGGFEGNQSASEYYTTIPLDSGSGNEVSLRNTTEQSLPANWNHVGYRSTVPPLWATITRAAIDIDYTYTIFIDKGKL